MSRAWTRSIVVALFTLALASCAQVSPPRASPSGELTPASVGSATSDAAQHVAVSRANGAVYVSGTTDGALDGVNKGGTDIFIRRFDRSGKLLWRKQLGTTKLDQAAGVATDKVGNVYVGMNTIESPYDLRWHGATLYKFSASGNLLWTRDPSPELEGMSAVRNDAAGNVYIFAASLDWESSNTSVLVEMSYSPNGSLRMSHGENTSYGIVNSFGPAVVDANGSSFYIEHGHDDGTSISMLAVDSSGNLLWSEGVGGWNSYGYPQNPNELGYFFDLHARGTALYMVAKTHGGSYFVLKFAKANGQELWRKKMNFAAQGVTADSQNNLIVVGATDAKTASARNMVYCKLSASGATLWTKIFGSAANDNLRDVAYYGDNEFYAVGFAAAALPNKPAAGGRDGVVMRLSSSGARSWVDQFGTKPR